MKHLLKAAHHRLTLRHFGGRKTPALDGKFGPYSLRNKHDRQQLKCIADHINTQLGLTANLPK